MNKTSGRSRKNRPMLSEMKSIFVSHVHIFPVIAFFVLLYNTMPDIHIPEINFTVYYTMVLYTMIPVYIVWFNSFQAFRKRNCRGILMRLLFDQIPAEILLLLVFAQWHFWLAILCTLLWVAIMVVVEVVLLRWEFGPGSQERQPKNYHYSLGRIAVFAMAAVCAVPAYFAVFVYEMQPPVYAADEAVIAALLSEVEEALAAGEQEEDIYQQNLALLSCFAEEQWDDYSTAEKLSLLKGLADMEAEILGIPEVPVSSALLDLLVLGQYDTETNEICIDVTYLEGVEYLTAGDCAEDYVITICHEMFHAYQQYCIENADWDSELAQTLYFDELRAWYENSNNYKSSSIYGYEEYAEQVLEKTAREYAEEEAEKIFACIEGIVETR